MIHAGKFADRLQREMNAEINFAEFKVDEIRRNRVDEVAEHHAVMQGVFRPFLLRHVMKAQDRADARAADPLRLRNDFHDAAVVQLDAFIADAARLPLDGLKNVEEAFRLFQPLPQQVQRFGGRRSGQRGFGNPPHVHEFLVENRHGVFLDVQH